MATASNLKENLLEVLPKYYDELHNLSNLQDIEVLYNDTKIFIKYFLEDISYLVSLQVNTEKTTISRETSNGCVGKHSVILSNNVVRGLVSDIYSSMSSEIYNTFTNSAKFGDCYYSFSLNRGEKLVQSSLDNLCDASKNS